MGMSDPYRIVLASAKAAYDVIERMKAEAKGEFFGELSPDLSRWRLTFGAKDGLTYLVYLDSLDDAKLLMQKWQGA
jgi:hypothetical protein